MTEEPVKGRYDICNDITKLISQSLEPCEDLRHIISTCGELYSMYRDREAVRVDLVVEAVLRGA